MTIKRALFCLCFVQCVATLVIASAAGYYGGHFYIYFVAGFWAVFCTCLFAWFSFIHTGAQAAKRVVKSIYRAEALKLMSAAGGLGLMMGIYPELALGILVTFLSVYLVGVITPMIITWKTSKIA